HHEGPRAVQRGGEGVRVHDDVQEHPAEEHDLRDRERRPAAPRRGHTSSGSVTTSTSAGPGWASASFNAPSSPSAVSTRTPCAPQSRAYAAKSGLWRLVSHTSKRPARC